MNAIDCLNRIVMYRKEVCVCASDCMCMYAISCNACDYMYVYMCVCVLVCITYICDCMYIPEVRVCVGGAEFPGDSLCACA